MVFILETYKSLFPLIKKDIDTLPRGWIYKCKRLQRKT